MREYLRVEDLSAKEIELCKELLKVGKEFAGDRFQSYYWACSPALKNRLEEAASEEEKFDVWIIAFVDIYNWNYTDRQSTAKFIEFEEYLQKEIDHYQNQINLKEEAKNHVDIFQEKYDELFEKVIDLEKAGKSLDAFSEELKLDKKMLKFRNELIEKNPEKRDLYEYAFKHFKKRLAEIKEEKQKTKEEKRSKLTVTGPIYDDDEKPTYHYEIEGVGSFTTTNYADIEAARKKYK